jgi:hypothetical protein
MENLETYKDAYTNPNITFPRIEARLVKTLDGYLLTAWLRRNAYGHRQELVSDFLCATRNQVIVVIKKQTRRHRAISTADDITEI